MKGICEKKGIGFEIDMSKPLFTGLVFSETGAQLAEAEIGGDGFYVLDDGGFKHHVRAHDIDKAVLTQIWEQMRGHEHEVAEQAARMTGQDDIFSHAVILQQLEHPEKQIEQILDQPIPEDVRTWLGMMGLRILVNYHGEVVRIEQPTRSDGE
jgi:hypothetical protein